MFLLRGLFVVTYLYIFNVNVFLVLGALIVVTFVIFFGLLAFFILVFAGLLGTDPIENIVDFEVCDRIRNSQVLRLGFFFLGFFVDFRDVLVIGLERVSRKLLPYLELLLRERRFLVLLVLVVECYCFCLFLRLGGLVWLLLLGRLFWGGLLR